LGVCEEMLAALRDPALLGSWPYISDVRARRSLQT
jgi:hypothetical protein